MSRSEKAVKSALVPHYHYRECLLTSTNRWKYISTDENSRLVEIHS